MVLESSKLVFRSVKNFEKNSSKKISDLNAILSFECSYEPVVVTVGCICLYNVFCFGIIQVNT